MRHKVRHTVYLELELSKKPFAYTKKDRSITDQGCSACLTGVFEEGKMIEPRCPAHNADMVSATRWIKVDGKPFPKPVHVCPVTDCLQAHGPEGYHQIPATEAVGNPIEQVLERKQ